jgi:DUF4097 and DUF4098 domain-containing protein YvlB
MSVYAYRRGSIFWALTLIAVGFLFLYQNFNPDVHPWRILAKFWPVLIIFWGASKLFDHLLAHAHPETVPPPLFSGSEVILLVLILVLGTLVSRIVLHPWQRWSDVGINVDEDEWANMFMNTYPFTQTGSWPVKPQPSVVIEDQHGDLEVRGSDQSAVEVVVKKVIRADSEEAARKLADQLKVEVVEEAGHYLLRSNRRSLPNGGRQVRTDLVVRVPKATSTQITSERGDILLDGLRGDQTLTAQHGDVHVANVEGLVRVHKSGGSTEIHDVKGDVEVNGRSQDVDISRVTGSVTANGEFPGSVEFQDLTQTLRFISSRTDLTVQKLRGRLSMEMGSLEASSIDGPFEVSTKDKDIQLNGFKHAVKISNTNGDINLSATVAPAHPIEIVSKKGGIELSLPPNSNFQIEATSQKGEVESDFSAPSLKVNQEGDAPSLTGSYGKGGPTIRLTTAYGTIHLIRESGAHPPNPPPPPSKPAEGSDETKVQSGRCGAALAQLRHAAEAGAW